MGKEYYGMKVHKAVIASGARRYSGPTIHCVDENYDTGRIMAQRIVYVVVHDTAEELVARVIRQVAAIICEERVIWREDDVPIIRNSVIESLNSNSIGIESRIPILLEWNMYIFSLSYACSTILGYWFWCNSQVRISNALLDSKLQFGFVFTEFDA
uniref:phosphoribosylglycinamide formyltransferase 1 n=1 Tax=Lactuca sativa TaxID=4236 RepID=A0A9R1UE90_LACSA|nr:hypothetical protein LSAT_V11C900498170 [Lactuca sativa]